MLQIPSLLYTMYGGILMGLAYDALRLFRFGAISMVICDLAFWLFAMPLAFAILMQTGGMAFRLFSIAGFVLGFAVYHFTLGVFVRGALQLVRKWAAMLWRQFNAWLA